MAEGSGSAGNDSYTMRFAKLVVRRRGVIAAMLVVSTAFFFYPILNSAMTAMDRPLPGPAVKIDTSSTLR